MAEQDRHQLKLITLPKFSPDTYSAWAYKVKSILRLYGVWELVNGEEPRPNLPARNPTAQQREAVNDWDKRNYQAHSSLLQTVDDLNTAKFYEIETANGIWDRLKTEYGKPNSSKMLLALNTISSIKPETSETLDDHLKKFEQAYADLNFHAEGKFLPKSVINTTLLATLGQPFYTTRQALTPQLNELELPALFDMIRTADTDSSLWKQLKGIPEELQILQTQVAPLESRLTALESRISNSNSNNRGNGRGYPNRGRGRGRYRGNYRGQSRGGYRGGYKGGSKG